jgi:hypothetical protein
MNRRAASLLRPLPILLVFSLGGCPKDEFQSVPDDAAIGYTESGKPVYPEAGAEQCKPGQDQDGDKIPDEVEGCKADSDADLYPDYFDPDSDNDGVPDAVEAGADPLHPVDSDKNGTPDFQEKDSDKDGIEDGDEDLNHDGLLGCCLSKCGEKRKGCPDTQPNECGKGQTCNAGNCQPAIDFLCSNGESDPKKGSTFPGGKTDKDLPSFVCRKSGETSSQGYKAIQFRKSTTGDWHVALEKDAIYGEQQILSPKPFEAVASFDLQGPGQAVAGFIVSIPSAPGGDVVQLAAAIATKISQQLPGKSGVQQLVSGSSGTRHDKFPTVTGTQLSVTLSAAKNPPAVRNDLLAVLLSRPASEVTGLAAASFGPSTTKHVLAFQTLLRTDGRLLIMGAVVEEAMSKDVTKTTSFHLDDLSNGTGLATAADADTLECDAFVLDRQPVADVIWIVDESGSMDDNRQDIVNNASDFFARAVKSGLDFRMGVAGMKDATESGVIVGKLCSKIITSVTSDDDGGTDRFLLPSEQSIFQGCVKNPPYYEGGWEFGLSHTHEAVTRHLPRKSGDPTKIRPEATLVVIIVTDEAPEELKSGTSYKGKSGFLSSSDYSITACSTSKLAQVNSYIKDTVDLFQGKSATHGAEGKAIVHMIGGVCKSNCGSAYMPVEYPWGYEQLVKATGGQIGDICQKNLGTTLQLIIDSITGAASPAILDLVPISASLAVALNQTQLERSRVKGFDYNAASNSLLFLGVPFNKGDQVVASYRRWVKQQPID